MTDGLESPPCGGLGVLNCYCGGDFCACAFNGSVDCPGCSDCQTDHGFDWDDELGPDLGGEG